MKKFEVSLLSLLSLTCISFAQYYVFSVKPVGYPFEKPYYGGYLIAKTNTYGSALYILEDADARLGNTKDAMIITNPSLIPKAYQKVCIEKFLHKNLEQYKNFNSFLFREDLKKALQDYQDVNIPVECTANTLKQFAYILPNSGIERKIKINILQYLVDEKDGIQ